MNSIPEQEILRRLKLIRDIRQNYMRRFNLSENDLLCTYNLLNRIDEAEHVKIEKKDDSIRIVFCKYVYEKPTATSFNPFKNSLITDKGTQFYWDDSMSLSGKNEKELGFILVDDKFLKQDCTDEDILEMEKSTFENVIFITKYKIESSISEKERELTELQTKIHEMKSKCNKLNNIIVESKN